MQFGTNEFYHEMHETMCTIFNEKIDAKFSLEKYLLGHNIKLKYLNTKIKIKIKSENN